MTLFPGITTRTIATRRLSVGVLEREGDNASAPDEHVVVFVHGNVSSSLFWQQAMLDLPPEARAIAIDLRGFGSTETLAVDATRGLRDFSDDVRATLDALGVGSAHLVGWSMGGGVVMRHAIDHGARSLTLVSPVSPYGFGGTRRDGTRLSSDDAGVGAGGANPDFVERLAAGDTSADAPTSPRNVFRGSYVAPDYTTTHEDEWVASMLTTSTAPGNYPGDAVVSDNWPGFAAGHIGVLNTMAPKYHNVAGIVDLAEKPPILWVHGTADAIVSDASFFDINYLGQVGVIPGWPGEDIAPAQQMVTQTRDVLDAYAAAGGSVAELALDGAGHSAHLERPAEFNAALLEVTGLGRSAIGDGAEASTPRHDPAPPTEAFIIPSSD